jgi:hypothetical protein
MAKKISKLTKEQEQKIPVYRDRYIALGRDTGKFTKEEIEQDVYDFYCEIMKTKKKPEILIFDSPYSLWQYVCKKTKLKDTEYVVPYIGGSFDSNIFSFYDFFINETDVTITDEMMRLYKIYSKTLNIGLMYPFDDVCLISQKPSAIHFNESGVIHCDGGPAIEYADGFSVYILNGVRVKKEYAVTPWDQLDPQSVIKETNAEVRRELVRKIGIERVVKKLGAKVVDKEESYELLLLDIGDENKRPYLKMINPSTGTYHIEGVPPGTKTVKDAIAWRNQTDEKPTSIS